MDMNKIKKPDKVEEKKVLTVDEVGSLGTEKTSEDLKKSITNSIANIDKKVKITLSDICKGLQNNNMFLDQHLFLDIEKEMYRIVDLSKENIDGGKAVKKTSLTPFIVDILKNVMATGEVDKFEINKANLDKIKLSIGSLKRTYNIKKEAFFVEDYVSCINVFRPTKLKEYKADKISYEDLLKVYNSDRFKRLKIVFDNNVGHTPTELKWFLNWVAMEINNPLAVRTAPLLIGDPGSGKGLIIKEIFEKLLYHESNVATVSNEVLLDKFNDVFEEKAFLIMNEICVTDDPKKANAISEYLKVLITEDKYMQRGMRVAHKEVVRTFSCIFSTNHDKPIKLENEDRRVSVFGRAIPLTSLVAFKILNETTEDFYPQYIKELNEFVLILKGLDYDSSVGTSVIMTKAKQNIIDNTNTKSDLFVSLFKENKYEELVQYLKSFDWDNEEKFFTDFEYMFSNGIFSNTLLYEIYITVYSVDTSKFNVKNIQRKSGSFWGNLLTKPDKPQMKVNDQGVATVLSFKVFGLKDLDKKKEALKQIFLGRYTPVKTTYSANDILADIEIENEMIDEDGETIPF